MRLGPKNHGYGLGMDRGVNDLGRHREQVLVARQEVAGEADCDAETDWKHVDARIVALGVERSAHEREVCRWLVEAERLGVPARLGFASLREYAARRLGLKGRPTEERVRVGRALLELPGLDDALSTGKLMWTAVREMTRVALPETEDAWLRWAAGKGVREVETQVAARTRGDLPRDPPDPTRVKHTAELRGAGRDDGHVSGAAGRGARGARRPRRWQSGGG